MRILSFCTWMAAGLIGLSSCQDIDKPKIPLRNDSTSVYYEDVLKPFYHGVASGDPLSDRVIIWTRITPEYQMSIVNITWEVATDQTFSDIVNKGTVKTDSTKDYTIKVDVTNLQPGSTYYYRFSGLGGTSLVGRTRTLSATTSKLKLAIVSCSNFEAGYFNAFGRIAEIEDLDAVVHLGDYIYEYESGKYGNESLDRKHLPSFEIVTLRDYRTRYAQYRLDPDFRKVHQNHPFISIWDDHEIANNAFMDGAQNHQQNQEGSYLIRKKAAVQTYMEWMPIREVNGDKIYRSFEFGDLAELIMLDGRLEGRVAPVDSISHTEYWGKDRTMISQQQMEWLMEKLTTSSALWKIIGNPVIFSDFNMSSIWDGADERNLDSWDGYPAQKKMISDQLSQQQVENVLIVTGDTHTSMAFECIANALDDKEPSPAFAVEFATPSISSSNPGTYDPPEVVLQREQGAYEANPHMKYVNLSDHGYLILQIEPDVARAEWHYVDRVDSISNQVSLGKSFIVKSGSYKLLEGE
ncbi:MAG: alkaline phosphatase D family protein [Bacteroidetes bacterium]|nr:alkaline phosphatase D family protein [Bacteroidota bacterium]